MGSFRSMPIGTATCRALLSEVNPAQHLHLPVGLQAQERKQLLRVASVAVEKQVTRWIPANSQQHGVQSSCNRRHPAPCCAPRIYTFKLKHVLTAVEKQQEQLYLSAGHLSGKVSWLAGNTNGISLPCPALKGRRMHSYRS